MCKNTAIIILAAGNGIRFGNDIHKQLSIIAGKTLLEHTLQNILSCKSLSQFILVINEAILEQTNKILKKNGWDMIRVVLGGATRTISSQQGIKNIIGNSHTKVLIHDVVRPFIPHDIIDQCLLELDHHEAVNVVIPSSDTIITSKTKEIIDKIPSRDFLFRGQTPQGFLLGRLVKAYSNIENANNYSDNCGFYLSKFPNAKIKLVFGTETNIKITYPEDLFIAEQLIYSGRCFDQKSSKNFSLQDKVIIVFGGTSGLGKALCDKLRTYTSTVYATSRTTGSDVSNIYDVENCLLSIYQKTGRIDAVVNYAGILQVANIIDMSQSEIERVINTNYLGSINIAKASLKYLSQTKGHLLFVSSSCYYKGRANYSVYSSTKAAVVNLTQALSDEWSKDDIRVNCISPHRSNTPMRRRFFPNEATSSLLQPEYVADKTISLLASNYTGIICHI